MPPNCWFCQIKAWDEEKYVCPFTGIAATIHERQKDCPLIEVPAPHGRLIDEDDLVERFVPKQAYFTENIVDKMSNAPTIIEAEGERK